MILRKLSQKFKGSRTCRSADWGLSRTPRGKMAALGATDNVKVVHIVRIYTDENGDSKFGEFKIKMSGSGK